MLNPRWQMETRDYQPLGDSVPIQQSMDEKTATRQSSHAKITIMLHGNCCMHYCTHIVAKIDDLNNNKSFVVEHLDHLKEQSDKLKKFDKFKEEDYCCINSVTLYSNRDVENFIQIYSSKFKHTDYEYCGNNCSNAVKFTLDYFFPDALYSKACYVGYQILGCAGFVGTLGLMNCFPAPPCCISTPTDVFKKAQVLSFSYGRYEPGFLPKKSDSDYKLPESTKDVQEVRIAKLG